MSKLADYLKETKARAEKATKGPWRGQAIEHVGRYMGYEIDAPHCQHACIALTQECFAAEEDIANGELMSHARTDIEVLTKMVKLLEERADHDITCEIILSGECDCGYAEICSQIETLVPEAKDRNA